MRFSSGGMWGVAMYFAKNAGYSDNGYKYVNSDGDRVLFLAEVLIGDCVTLASNTSLKMPPNKPNGQMYDSVMGNTGGSDVYMVYHSSKAYPRYLVTYTA